MIIVCLMLGSKAYSELPSDEACSVQCSLWDKGILDPDLKDKVSTKNCIKDMVLLKLKIELLENCLWMVYQVLA